MLMLNIGKLLKIVQNNNKIIKLTFCIFSGVCNFKSQCEELKKIVKQKCPGAEVVCHTGRRGAFEVKINDTLVHSKLNYLAFPNYDDVARNVEFALNGKPLEKVKEQPITDCVIQ